MVEYNQHNSTSQSEPLLYLTDNFLYYSLAAYLQA